MLIISEIGGKEIKLLLGRDSNLQWVEVLMKFLGFFKKSDFIGDIIQHSCALENVIVPDKHDSVLEEDIEHLSILIFQLVVSQIKQSQPHKILQTLVFGKIPADFLDLVVGQKQHFEMPKILGMDQWAKTLVSDATVFKVQKSQVMKSCKVC